MKKVHVLVVFFLLCTHASFGYAIDLIKLNHGHSEKDFRHLYNWSVLERALEITKEDFGPYELKYTGSAIPNHQRLKELMLGKYLNVALNVTNEQWESTIEPIRIPVRLGSLKYRVLLIHKRDAARFANVNSFDDLKKFKAGIRQSWSTKDVFMKYGVDMVYAYSYEALFAMLDKGRFDFVPRGVHEVYFEMDTRQQQYEDLLIEPHLVLEFPPSNFYTFVSPKEPRIQLRLEQGLSTMQESGELKAMFDDYYGEQIKRANISSRRMIKVE